MISGSLSVCLCSIHAKHIQVQNHWGTRDYFIISLLRPISMTAVCYFLSLSLQGLEDDLKSQLLVQHIASEVIMNAVTGSMNNDNPKKSLVLSLHGTTGTGKNLASQLIVKNIYKKGMDSRFVHFFSAVVHFPHVDHVETYKVVWIMCLWFHRPVPVAVDWCMLSIL